MKTHPRKNAATKRLVMLVKGDPVCDKRDVSAYRLKSSRSTESPSCLRGNVTDEAVPKIGMPI